MANILTLPTNEAVALLQARKQKKIAESQVADHTEAMRQKKLALSKNKEFQKKMRVLRHLLKSGHKNSMFGGFDGDEQYWLNRIEEEPGDWMWVECDSGILGVPFPGGKSYCFAPNTPFPIHKYVYQYLKESDNIGKIKDIK